MRMEFSHKRKRDPKLCERGNFGENDQNEEIRKKKTLLKNRIV